MFLTVSFVASTAENYQINQLQMTKEHRDCLELIRKRLLLHHIASIHYDFQSDATLRQHLHKTPYNCALKNYVLSLKRKPIELG